MSGHDLSFDPYPEEDEDFAPATYLPSPNSDPAQAVERDNAGANDHERLTAALAKLDERSRMILSRRWLAENKATLHELAAEYGVSAERSGRSKPTRSASSRSSSRRPDPSPHGKEEGRTVTNGAPFVVSASRLAQRQRDERELHAAVLLTAEVRIVRRDRAGSPTPTVMMRSVRTLRVPR